MTVHSGWRIYQGQGNDESYGSDDRSSYNFTLKRLGLASDPLDAVTFQEEEEKQNEGNFEENEGK